VNAVDPSEIVGAPAGPPLSGDALDAQTHAVSKLLRCPVCQGLSVADSPSESALAMKAEVQDLVARGYDEEQILLYFEASYGEFIRLEPTFEGFNVAVWLAPVGLVVAGLGVIGALLRVSRRRGSAGSGVPSPRAGAAPPPIDPELEPYLRRVREESR
jgi:cytochrome c-type biogenesis protein CcmH